MIWEDPSLPITMLPLNFAETGTKSDSANDGVLAICAFSWHALVGLGKGFYWDHPRYGCSWAGRSAWLGHHVHTVEVAGSNPARPTMLVGAPPPPSLWHLGVWGVLGVVLWFWVIFPGFLGVGWVLSGYCLGTVQLLFCLGAVSVTCVGLWLVTGVRGFFPMVWGGFFGMSLCSFWCESIVIGGVFRFLSL
jgi:hypothetical protein